MASTADLRDGALPSGLLNAHCSNCPTMLAVMSAAAGQCSSARTGT
jgi:hypothetical protein